MPKRTMVYVFILVLFISSTTLTKSYRSRPKIITNFSNVTILRPITRNVQRLIVRSHNRFRSIVQPPASNMLKMKWHKEAARSAQKWADQCMFLTHDTPAGRHDHNHGACGQNIFVSTHPVPWLFAMRTWFAEKKYFAYGSKSNVLKKVGHYTQMVWGSSQFVGCGFAKCNRNSGFSRSSHYYNYVCNYCPSGNKQGKVGTPYKAGKRCESCPNSCSNNLCLNGCKFSNDFSNCDDLDRQHPSYLCQSLGNQCRATCRCKGRIYE